MQHLKLSFISLLMVIMIKTAGAAVFMAGDKDALPSCQNPYLLEQVKKHIQDYQKEHPYKNIIEYRQQKLLLKNLSGFRQIASQDFDIDENIETANKLITLKINAGLEDSDIVLCRSIGSEKNYIYILIYPEEGKSKVEILNTNKEEYTTEALSFLF